MCWCKLGFIIFLLTGAFGAKPIDPSEIKFFLYTADNPDHRVDLKKALSDPDFAIPIEQTKILIHGFETNTTDQWIMSTKIAFMEKKDVNVIMVDWNKYSFKVYWETVQYISSIGKHLGDVLVELDNKFKLKFDQFHLIGHSLGAHIAGVAGKHVFGGTSQKLGRITGLDPAGILFLLVLRHIRLHRNDADFVDVIHTDALIFGMKLSLGHADFWPNGGYVQRGCPNDTNCSHLRAPLYFQESIGNKNFMAKKCLFWGRVCYNMFVPMGDECPTSARGDFYLETNEKSPFAIVGVEKL